MLVRTQISLDSEEHRRAKRRAAELNMSLAEYVRRALRKELGGKTQAKADITTIFDLGSSGGSDVASHKDRYLGDAAWREHLRKTGQLDRLDAPAGGH